MRGMAPLYDGHDYYKKMLELQDKLRRSEEERIRLEERFTLLLQESHNRHDACINRLRVRYIEFLEEQRARDERNHKLLNSLDRVDSSLSLITAKTDRLNILRKQYEANLLRSYATRPTGSVTGDSGIASQNERGYASGNVVGHQTLPTNLRVKISSPSPVNIGQNDSSNQSIPMNSSNLSTHQRTPLLLIPETIQNVSYGRQVAENLHTSTPLSGIPYQRNTSQEMFQNHVNFHLNRNQVENPQIRRYATSSPYSGEFYEAQNRGNLHVGSTTPTTRGEVPLDPRNLQRLPGNWEDNSNFHPSQEIAKEIPRYEKTHLSADKIIPSHRFDFSPVARSVPYNEINSTPNILQSQSIIEDRNWDKIGIKPMHNVGVSFPSIDTSFLEQGYPRKIPPSNDSNYPSTNPQETLKSEAELITRSYDAFEPKDSLKRNVLSRFDDPRLSHRIPSMSRKNFDEKELDEQERTTRLLENELDRYIGKIRNLHRDQEPQSQEEIDHEQNTSGDLLNVTLSDDGVDISHENQMKDTKMPNEVQKMLALADELASKTVEVPEKIRTNGKRGEDDLDVGNRDTMEEEREGRSVSRVFTRDGISDGIARYKPELEQSLHRGIKEIAKQERNDKENLRETSAGQKYRDGNVNGYANDILRDENIVEDKLMDSGVRKMGEDDSIENKYNLYVGQEMGVEEEALKAVEELEPWDISSVEKQIREMRFEDEEFAGDIRNTDSEETTTSERFEVQMKEESKEESQEKIPSLEIEGNIKDLSRNEENVEQVLSKHRTDESASLSETNQYKNEVSSSKNEEEYDAKEQIDRSPDQSQNPDQSESQAQEHSSPDESAHYEAVDQLQDQDYQQYQDQEYAENLGEQYVDYGNEQYDQYANDPSNEYAQVSEAQYEQDPKAQYGEDSNAQYDPNIAGQYEQDPNAEYEQDPNAQYQQDPSTQYEQDPNAQYQQDPNAQYEQDPNTQYEQGPNAQYQEDPNAAYEQDPNAQYEQDPNAQYQQDPNAEYEQDPNAQYQQDPNAEYEQDPNAQYQQDTNAQYPQDPNETQEYSYDYDQQQYAAAGYIENDPNQLYTYPENVQYDDQVYDSTQGQEYPTANAEGAEQGEENTETQEDIKNEVSSKGVDVEKTQDDEQAAGSDKTAEPKKKKDVIKSLLESDTESTIERNTSNTESDFDFN